MKKLKTFLLIMASVIVGSELEAKELVILHTNDTHSQIDPKGSNGLGGVARRKVLIDSVRNAYDNVLLVDAGDVVQGTLYFNLYKGEVEERVMNELGYDLRIMGNHEFDNGMDVLAQNYAKSHAKLLCSNYQTRNTPLQDVFQPYDIKEIEGKRIAFMPINLQPEGMISKMNSRGMGYVDEIEAANNIAWFLKNIMQADMVIALTHIGYGPDTMLIRSSKDIDMVIGGHSHTKVDPAKPGKYKPIIKNADGRDVLVAQTGGNGEYLGQITIDLDDPQLKASSKLIKVDSRLDSQLDPKLLAIIDEYRQGVDELKSIYVAESKQELDRKEAGLLNFASDFVYDIGCDLAGNVDMSIMNKGGLRNDIPKGKVSKGDIIAMMPFFNYVQVIEVSGEDLLKTFNIMASQYGQGVSSNVEAIYDPVSKECVEILISGKPLDTNRTYRVATINYLAEGGDYMTPLTNHKLIAESKSPLYDDMTNYLLKKGKKAIINPSQTKRMKSK